MKPHSHSSGRAVVAACVLALPVAGAGVALGAGPPQTTAMQTSTQRPTMQKASAPSSIEGLAAIAQRRYAVESHGGMAHHQLHRVARDATLLAALRSGDRARLRAYAERRFRSVWYHWHVSRVRIVSGSRALVDTGVPFVVAPVQTTLRDAGGRPLATLQVSIQDVIGFVRYMHRNYPVDVVVRGVRPGHVRSSLPAAARVQLPDRGSVTLAGRRYEARSFQQTALGNEPVKVWVLQRV